MELSKLLKQKLRNDPELPQDLGWEVLGEGILEGLDIPHKKSVGNNILPDTLKILASVLTLSLIHI